jgi:prepilin-type N-terminal cleavage/methylation domain-containing protein
MNRAILTKLFQNKVQGFTLLETLASIAILSLAIIGPLTVISNSSVYARQTRDVITATYLAEESIELLQNQYNSIYISCKKNPSAPECTPVSSTETSGQIAWRLFKENMSFKNSQPSCFTNDNPSGCTYDMVSFLETATDTPVRYQSYTPNCSSLVDIATTSGAFAESYIKDVVVSAGSVKPLRHIFVCNNVTAHTPLLSATTTKSYTRIVKLESVSTFDTGSYLSQYNDDIRITSAVKFKGVNGATRVVQVVRFMHSLP